METFALIFGLIYVALLGFWAARWMDKFLDENETLRRGRCRPPEELEEEEKEDREEQPLSAPEERRRAG